MAKKPAPIVSFLFAEGATEIKLLHSLGIKFTTEKRLNFLQTSIKRWLATLKDNTYVFIILDMDLITIGHCHCAKQVSSSIQMLNQNIKDLHRSKRVKHIYLIPQYYDFEDELALSCNLSVKKFLSLSVGNKKSKDDFKTSFLSSSTPLSILSKASFDENQLWINHNAHTHNPIFQHIPSANISSISLSAMRTILKR